MSLAQLTAPTNQLSPAAQSSYFDVHNVRWNVPKRLRRLLGTFIYDTHPSSPGPTT